MIPIYSTTILYDNITNYFMHFTMQLNYRTNLAKHQKALKHQLVVHLNICQSNEFANLSLNLA